MAVDNNLQINKFRPKYETLINAEWDIPFGRYGDNEPILEEPVVEIIEEEDINYPTYVSQDSKEEAINCLAPPEQKDLGLPDHSYSEANLQFDSIKGPEAADDAVETGWEMFEKLEILGQGKGAFSTVYKVKCRTSTKLNDDGVTRLQVLLDSSVSVAGSQSGKGRRLKKDKIYAIKEIDVADIPEQDGVDTLNEIQTMFRIDSPYFVQYYDSFIDDQRINLVIEYCSHGDLCSLIEK